MSFWDPFGVLLEFLGRAFGLGGFLGASWRALGLGGFGDLDAIHEPFGATKRRGFENKTIFLKSKSIEILIVLIFFLFFMFVGFYLLRF